MTSAEFLNEVEGVCSSAMTEGVIDPSRIPCDGTWTTGPNYDHCEFIRLVAALGEEVGTPVLRLSHSFGKHLFQLFVERYPHLFDAMDSSFDLLPLVDAAIHREVAMLYPDAELPAFRCARHGPEVLVLDYESARPFAELCHGLIQACIEYFGEPMHIDVEDLSAGRGTRARFTLTRVRR